MVHVVNLLIAGLFVGSIYSVFGLCFSIVHRISKVINLAIGEFAMIGTLGTVYISGKAGVATPLAALISIACAAVIALAFDALVLKRAIDARSSLAQLFMLTFALSILLQGVGANLFGRDIYSVPPVAGSGAVHLGGISATRQGSLLLGAALVTAGMVALYLRRTLHGRAMTACGDNPQGCLVVGIRPTTFRRLGVVVTAALAAVFGILVSPLTSMSYDSGFEIAVLGLVAATLAGLDSPFKAFGFGLAIGVAEGLAASYISSNYGTVVVLAALTVVVVGRPSLLGLEARA